MLFSLMTAALLASYVSKFVSPVPLYHALAKNFEYPEPKKAGLRHPEQALKKPLKAAFLIFLSKERILPVHFLCLQSGFTQCP